MKRQERFSIRKLSVGAASVLLGTLLFVGQGQTVAANEQVEDLTVQESAVDDGTVEELAIQEVATEEAVEVSEVSAEPVAVETEPVVDDIVPKTAEAEQAEKPVEDVEVSSLFADEVEKEEKTVLAAQTEDREGPQLVSISQTDKAEYKAGETVKLTVQATDATAVQSVDVYFNDTERKLGSLWGYASLSRSNIEEISAGLYQADIEIKIPINRPTDTFTITDIYLTDSIGYSTSYSSYNGNLEPISFNVIGVPVEEQVGSVLVKYQVIDENNNVIDTLKEIYTVEKQKDESFYSFYEYPDYNLEIDGKTYVLESSLSAGNYQSGYIVGGETIEVNYYYREEKYGSVVVRYLTVDEKDNTVSTVIKEINVADMQREGDWVGYTNYDDRIEYDGKIYVLDYANSDDTFFDIAVVGNETLEYNYYYNEAKLGSVLVRRHLVDGDGQVVSLLSEEYAVQNGAEGDYYYTDNQYELEQDGLTYRLVSDLTDGETSGNIVGNETKIVNYYYRTANGSVLVRYHIVDENGNVISTADEKYAVENGVEDHYYLFDGYQYDTINVDDKTYILDYDSSDDYHQEGYIVGGQTKVVNYYYKEQLRGSVLVRRHLVDNDGQVISLLSEEYAVQDGIEGDYYYTDDSYIFTQDGLTYRLDSDLTVGEVSGNIVGNETKIVDYYYRSVNGSVLLQYFLLDDSGNVVDLLKTTYAVENGIEGEYYYLNNIQDTIIEIDDKAYLIDQERSDSLTYSGGVQGGETKEINYYFTEIPNNKTSELDLDAIRSGDFSSVSGRWEAEGTRLIIENDGSVYSNIGGTYLYGQYIGKLSPVVNEDGSLGLVLEDRENISENNSQIIIYPVGELYYDDYSFSDYTKDRLVVQTGFYIDGLKALYRVDKETVNYRKLNLEIVPNEAQTGFSLLTTFADDSERKTVNLFLTITNSQGEEITFTGPYGTLNFDWPNLEQGIYTAYNPQFTDGVYKIQQTTPALSDDFSIYSGETYFVVRDGKVHLIKGYSLTFTYNYTFKDENGQEVFSSSISEEVFSETDVNLFSEFASELSAKYPDAPYNLLEDYNQKNGTSYVIESLSPGGAGMAASWSADGIYVGTGGQDVIVHLVTSPTEEPEVETPTEEITAIPTEAPVEDDKQEAVIDTPTEEPSATPEVTEEPSADEPVIEPEVDTPTDEVTAVPTEAPVEEEKPEAVVETPTEEPSTMPEVTEEPSVDEPVSEPEVESPTEEATAVPTEAPVEEDKPEAVVEPTAEETATSPEATEEPSSEEVITEPVVEEEVSAIPDYAPEEEALPEYVFDPADFQDVLEPSQEEDVVTPTEEPTTEAVVTDEVAEETSKSQAGGAAGLATDKEEESALKSTKATGAAAAATPTAKASYSRTARANAEKSLPNTGDANALLSLVGFSLTTLGLAGRKRRR